MKDRKIKQVLFEKWVPVEGERINRNGERKWIWWISFAYMYEHKTVKPV
jgi:hypothetical protein